ncbi:hypothetical protein FGO68_gene12617 [Halteria grandinella]|uniref:Uncharacterized protein n=1 Tax=Halteria grandinella TaxID=5974 RepID=A0A8J8P1D2_HALGN|nr:hypothetical protein FGO68_gene12617 [Halteria grandinella]
MISQQLQRYLKLIIMYKPLERQSSSLLGDQAAQNLQLPLPTQQPPFTRVEIQQDSQFFFKTQAAAHLGPQIGDSDQRIQSASAATAKERDNMSKRNAFYPSHQLGSKSEAPIEGPQKTPIQPRKTLPLGSQNGDSGVGLAQVGSMGLQDILKMHTEEQMKEMHKLQGKMTNTITLKRSTQNQVNCLGEGAASVSNTKTAALHGYSSITMKNAQNPSSFHKSSTSRQKDNHKIANFTMKLYDMQQSHVQLDEVGGNLSSEDEEGKKEEIKINVPKVNSSFSKGQQSKSVLNDSLLNDRIEEKTSLLPSSARHANLSSAQRNSAAKSAAVPLVTQAFIESPTNEDASMNNVEEFNFNVTPELRKVSISKQLVQPLISSFKLQSATPLAMKIFPGHIQQERGSKQLNFGRFTTTEVDMIEQDSVRQEKQDIAEGSFVSQVGAQCLNQTVRLQQIEQHIRQTATVVVEEDSSSNRNNQVISPPKLFLKSQNPSMIDDYQQPFDSSEKKAGGMLRQPSFQPFTQQHRQIPRHPNNHISNISLYYNPVDQPSFDQGIYGTATNRLRLDRKIDEIKLLKKRTKTLEKAIILFNNAKYKETIEYLLKIEAIQAIDAVTKIVSHDQLTEVQVTQLSRFLYEETGLNKNNIGEYLGSPNALNQRVNFAFFQNFSFPNIVIDVAMRGIFKKIRLPKEFQQIERIIKAFSSHYWNQNQERLLENNIEWNQECIEFLAMSILVLNTNIHSDKIPKSLKLSKPIFIKTNVSVLKDLVNPKFLGDIYDRLAKQQYEAKIEIQEKFFKRVNDYSDHLPSEGTRDTLFKIQGTVFIKYGRMGKPHKRLVKFNADETQLEWRDPDKATEKTRYIKTEEILRVIIGADHTKVMQRFNIPNEYDNMCFSIITSNRTLDLRYDDPKVIQQWVEKIKIAMTVIQHKKESLVSEQDVKYQLSQQESYEKVLQTLWKSEILLKWNSFWDPTKQHFRTDKDQSNIELPSTKERRAVKNRLLQIFDDGESLQNFDMLLGDNFSYFISRIDHIWYEGLPDFARVCIWPMLIQNSLSLTHGIYFSLKDSIALVHHRYQRNSMDPPQLNMYLTSINQDINPIPFAHNNSIIAQEIAVEANITFEKISSKVEKWVKQRSDDLEDQGIDQETFKDILQSILRCFSIYRPDIGFVSGLEKVTAHILMLFLPFQNYEQEDFSFDSLEAEVFTYLASLTQVNYRHISSFLLSDVDEISWRLDYFDSIFQRELPELSLHFKAINFQSQLYLYDWFLSLFSCVLPVKTVWRIWDQYFLRGEIFLYQAALGLLRYKQCELLSQPLNQCLKVFKQMRYEETVNQDKLFNCISDVLCASNLEFNTTRGTQLMAHQKACIFKLFL